MAEEANEQRGYLVISHHKHPELLRNYRYYIPLYIVLGVFIPVWIPIYFFGETWWKSVWSTYFVRYMTSLNFTWLVNSAAHIHGNKPYDKTILPSESWYVSLVTMGEGWHNYHHTFPWDYRAAEFKFLNATAYMIKFAEFIGLAYDLKTASPEMVAQRMLRTGDGSRLILGSQEDIAVHHPIKPSSSSDCKPTTTVHTEPRSSHLKTISMDPQ